MATVTGNLVDFTGYTMAGFSPVVQFVPSSGALYENNLLPKKNPTVVPDALGNFSINLVPNTETLPLTFYTVLVRWLDSAGNFVGQDDFPGLKVRVPNDGGQLKDLLVTRDSPFYAYVSEYLLPSVDYQTFEYNPTTGDLYFTEDI